MKFRKTLGVLVLAGASLTIPALADSNILQVKVPFAFVAGGKRLPARTYTLRLSESGQIVFVLGPSQSSMFSGVPAGTLAYGSKPTLMFKRYGADEYLVGIETAEMGSRSIPLQPLH